jgi:hypothetical protein
VGQRLRCGLISMTLPWNRSAVGRASSTQRSPTIRPIFWFVEVRFAGSEIQPDPRAVSDARSQTRVELALRESVTPRKAPSRSPAADRGVGAHEQVVQLGRGARQSTATPIVTSAIPMTSVTWTP